MENKTSLELNVTIILENKIEALLLDILNSQMAFEEKIQEFLSAPKKERLTAAEEKTFQTLIKHVEETLSSEVENEEDKQKVEGLCKKYSSIFVDRFFSEETLSLFNQMKENNERCFN